MGKVLAISRPTYNLLVPFFPPFTPTSIFEVKKKAIASSYIDDFRPWYTSTFYFLVQKGHSVENEKLSLTDKILREINTLVEPLLSRYFCQNSVREEFPKFPHC